MVNKISNIIVVLTIVGTILVGYVFAVEEDNPIDMALIKCLSKTGVTSEMAACLKDAYDQWEVEISKCYDLLIKSLSDEAKDKLKLSQEAWLKLKELELDFIPTYYPDMGSYSWICTIVKQIKC